MTASHISDHPDERLLEEALVVIRDARDRLPRDYLIAIAVSSASWPQRCLLSGCSSTVALATSRSTCRSK